MNAPKTFFHIPVLLQEVMQQLQIREGATALDLTAGGGGHLRAIAQAVGEKGRVIAFDRDLRAHEEDAAGGVVKDFPQRVRLVHAPFSELSQVLESLQIHEVDALLCDLGVSSVQLDEDARGFSFLRDGPLDMRMDTSCGESAYELIGRVSEKELADILYLYGEEWRSRRIAKAIKAAWPLPNSTIALAALIEKASGGRRGRIHPATKSFQALRIAVNGELSELQRLLAIIPKILAKGGRAALISFHSLEDRLVKQAFRALAHGEEKAFRVLTKKPICAQDEENTRNLRARSAKLRVIERI